MCVGTTPSAGTGPQIYTCNGTKCVPRALQLSGLPQLRFAGSVLQLPEGLCHA